MSEIGSSYFYYIITVISPRDSHAMGFCTKHARNIRAFVSNRLHTLSMDTVEISFYLLSVQEVRRIKKVYLHLSKKKKFELKINIYYRKSAEGHYSINKYT